MKKRYLCYWELHVEDLTYYIHTIIEAESEDKALDQMKDHKGKSHHLQAKGCLGEFTEEKAIEFMDIPQCLGLG